jgi:hypothetical protein
VEVHVPSREELADETARVRKVRHLVDIATSLIMQAGMSRREAETLVAGVRSRILDLFPGSEDTFEIVYGPRFRRIIDEFARPDAHARGVVIRFPARTS